MTDIGEVGLGAKIMKEVTRYNDGSGCTRRQLVDNILILIDQFSRVSAPSIAPVDQCGVCDGYAHKNYPTYKICNNCWVVMPWREDGRVFEHKPYPYTCAADNEIIVTPVPASTVAPQEQSDAPTKCPACGEQDCFDHALRSAPASPAAPKSFLREPVRVDVSSPLVVTRNGVPCPDQEAALEEFKEACRVRAQQPDHAEAPAAPRGEAEPTQELLELARKVYVEVSGDDEGMQDIQTTAQACQVINGFLREVRTRCRESVTAIAPPSTAAKAAEEIGTLRKEAELIAYKWAETLSEGEQSVLLTSSLRRLRGMITAIIERCFSAGDK